MAAKTMMPMMAAAAMEGWPYFQDLVDCLDLRMVAVQGGVVVVELDVSFQKRVLASLSSWTCLDVVLSALVSGGESGTIWSIRLCLTVGIRRGLRWRFQSMRATEIYHPRKSDGVS